jgi:hypothetical protein
MLPIRIAKPYLFLVFLIVITAQSRAQSIDSLMVTRSARFAIEKIYIHFDKSVYRPGDSIWYKAYLQVNGRPSEISKTLYTELVDSAGRVKQHNTAPLLVAMAAGHFVLRNDWKEESFRIRAYTAWMKNGDSSFFYDQQLRVITSATVAKQRSEKKETQLQFFPEGGDLIAGMESKLAFKANDAYGLPAEVAGTIRNAKDEILGSFQTIHNGMGFCWWTPKDTSPCFAIWKEVDGRMHRSALPAIQEQGTTIRVTPGENQLQFQITRSQQRNLLLIAHMNQALVYRARISATDKRSVSGAVPTAQLPSGILTLTVFDDEERPVAERVVFVNNHEYLFDAKVSVGKQSLAKRGLNEIQLGSMDTLQGDFSISVTDAVSDGVMTGADNIVSRLLLSADIRGRVYQPYAYFADQSDSTQALLDLVMLTHGWRRFNWELLRSAHLPEVRFTDGNYIGLTVNLDGIKAKKIKADETMNAVLQFRDSGKYMLQIPYAGKGQFTRTGLLFYDTVTAGYSFNKDQSLLLRGQPHLSSSLLPGPQRIGMAMNDPFLLASPDADLIRNNNTIAAERLKHNFSNQKAKVLENVVVKATKSKFQLLDEKYASGVFAFSSSYSYDILSDSFSRSYKNVIDYIQAKLPGVFVIYSTTTGEPQLTWRGKALDTWLDQMNVRPYDLVSIPISNVAYIKVYNEAESLIFPRRISASVLSNSRRTKDSATLYTISGAQPNLVVYTRHPEDFNAGYKPQNFGKWTIAGYTVTRQFYSPDYSTPNENDVLPDLRTTLLWKPDIHLDKTHQSINLKFYNNDFSKKLRVIIEGMNEEGQLYHYEKILE